MSPAGASTDRCNFAADLIEIAARKPDAPALIVQGRGAGAADSRVSWKELCERSSAFAHGLVELGVARGDRVSVFVRPGRDWLALTYALLWMGAVPVLIDPGMGREGVARCIAAVTPRAFIGVPRAHLLRFAAPASFRSVELFVTAGGPRPWGGASLESLAKAGAQPFEPVDTGAGDAAAILFTSGSTGPAKGVLYTHGMFAAQLASLRELYDFRPGEVDLACLPLFALFAAGLEWTSVLPDMDVSLPATCDPSRIAAAINDHGVTNTFGSPAIWKRVAPWCDEHGVRLPSLRRLMIAGAPVPPRLVAACRALLDEGGEVHTPYGATEALPVASAAGADLCGELRERVERGEGMCVGRPAPGVEVRIVRIDDGPLERWSDELALADGEPGEICVRGPAVTREYALDEAATRLAKIPGDGGSAWHRMGDIGRLDADGRLWFLGRKSHRIESPQGLVMPVGLEAVFDQHELVEKSAVVGVGPRGEERAILIVVPKKLPRAATLRERLAIEILRVGLWFPACKSVRGVLFRKHLPVDVRHNAKIDRVRLRDWASTRADEVYPRHH